MTRATIPGADAMTTSMAVHSCEARRPPTSLSGENGNTKQASKATCVLVIVAHIVLPLRTHRSSVALLLSGLVQWMEVFLHSHRLTALPKWLFEKSCESLAEFPYIFVDAPPPKPLVTPYTSRQCPVFKKNPAYPSVPGTTGGVSRT